MARTTRQKAQTRARTEKARGVRKRQAKAQRKQLREKAEEEKTQAIVEAAENDDLKFVECPVCGEQQADMGRGVRCESCGHGPMPVSEDLDE